MTIDNLTYLLMELRSKIDEIDFELIQLLKERMRLSIEVGEVKRSYDAPVYCPRREAEILERVGNGEYGESLQEVYREIFRVSRQVQD